MSHENLKVLNDWCNSTKVLHLWVNFQNRTGDWAVRVLTNALGKAHPLRTHIGFDLEMLCADILPLAKEKFEREKASIMKRDAEYGKRQQKAYYQDIRDIERMHHSASDF